MRLGETIEAPTMGQRTTCSETTASTGGELFRFDFWMRGGGLPPPLHVHPRRRSGSSSLSVMLRLRGQRGKS